MYVVIRFDLARVMRFRKKGLPHSCRLQKNMPHIAKKTKRSKDKQRGNNKVGKGLRSMWRARGRDNARGIRELSREEW